MTEDQSCAPWSARSTALVPREGAAADEDLFALVPDGNGGYAHPDFVARQAIWRDQAAGVISVAEARRRSANIGREKEEREARRASPARPRHTRPAPNESRQYAGNMATTAARDDRLTPNAKAFLQVLRARCGKGRETTITKGTAGDIMSRSKRTIRRYLCDLVRFGYIELAIRRDGRGMHLGLTITLTNLVKPFYEEAKSLARWLAEGPKAVFRPFNGVFSSGEKGVTFLSPKNQEPKNFPSTSFRNADTGRLTARERLRKSGRTGFVPQS